MTISLSMRGLFLLEIKKTETVQNVILKVFIRGYQKRFKQIMGRNLQINFKEFFRKYWSRARSRISLSIISQCAVEVFNKNEQRKLSRAFANSKKSNEK